MPLSPKRLVDEVSHERRMQLNSLPGTAVVNLLWDMQAFFCQPVPGPWMSSFFGGIAYKIMGQNTKAKDIQGPGSCTSSVATVPRMSQ